MIISFSLGIILCSASKYLLQKTRLVISLSRKTSKETLVVRVLISVLGLVSSSAAFELLSVVGSVVESVESVVYSDGVSNLYSNVHLTTISNVNTVP